MSRFSINFRFARHAGNPAKLTIQISPNTDSWYQSRRLEDSSGKDLRPEGVTPVEKLLVCRQIPERDFFQLPGLRLRPMLFDMLHPGFIRLLQKIIAEIHKAGKWVGLCGDMAAEWRNLPVLLGLGLDEISVPP